jgi:hypothetical protein
MIQVTGSGAGINHTEIGVAGKNGTNTCAWSSNIIFTIIFGYSTVEFSTCCLCNMHTYTI